MLLLKTDIQSMGLYIIIFTKPNQRIPLDIFDKTEKYYN